MQSEAQRTDALNSRPPIAPEPNSNGAVRVLVADGDVLARKALHGALTDTGLSVVGQAADAAHALDLAHRCAPQVLLVDAELPPDGGLAAMEALATVKPEIHVIILAHEESGTQGLRALARGAAGYLERQIDLASLGRAIEGVVAGEGAISRAMTAGLIDYVQEVSSNVVGMRPVNSPLTTREWEVLEQLRAHASTAEIAKNLVVSPETVHSHVQHILRKLHAHSRAEAVEIAEQLTPLPDLSA